MKQLDLFKPEPMIRGDTNASGRDVYYCRVRKNWTTDPEEITYWQRMGEWFAYGGEEPELD